jgi:hypothetical protein
MVVGGATSVVVGSAVVVDGGASVVGGVVVAVLTGTVDRLVAGPGVSAAGPLLLAPQPASVTSANPTARWSLRVGRSRVRCVRVTYRVRFLRGMGRASSHRPSGQPADGAPSG